MLTGDLNVAVVEWIVQYRVSDPYRYLFKVRNVEETFRSMNEAVMREVYGTGPSPKSDGWPPGH
jgi:membrane protease subunit HflK